MPKSIDIELIASCPLFMGIPPQKLEELTSSIHYSIRNYSAGELIATAGTPVNSLMIVTRGSVRGEMNDFNGKMIKIEDIEAPRPLAVAFIFGNSANFPVSLIANNAVQLMFIPKDQLIWLLQHNEIILKRFMDNISSRAQFLSEKLRFLSFQSLKGKLAQFLMELSGNNECIVTLPMNQEELAGLMGVTRPSLARTIGELNEMGIIESKAKTIRIIDPQALAALVRS
jgi:CRP-like cAMP-binding protein